MATRITRNIIESYLNCKYKGHLKLAGESGTRSDYEGMTAAGSEASRAEALAGLVARFGDGGGPRSSRWLTRCPASRQSQRVKARERG